MYSCSKWVRTSAARTMPPILLGLAVMRRWVRQRPVSRANRGLPGSAASAYQAACHPTARCARLRPRGPARPAERRGRRAGRTYPLSYLVKYQYSGSRVNSGLNVTLCSLLDIAWIPNGLGSGTHMNGSWFAPYVA